MSSFQYAYHSSQPIRNFENGAIVSTNMPSSSNSFSNGSPSTYGPYNSGGQSTFNGSYYCEQPRSQR